MVKLFCVVVVTPLRIKYEVVYLDAVTLECTFENFPRKFSGQVTWKKRRKFGLAETETIKSTRETFRIDSDLKASLLIPVSRENDSGFYSCMIQILDTEFRDTEVQSVEIELCIYGRKCVDTSILLKNYFVSLSSQKSLV